MAAVKCRVKGKYGGFISTYDLTAVNGTDQIIDGTSADVTGTLKSIVITKLYVVADPSAAPSFWDGSGTATELIGSMKVSSVGSCVNLAMDFKDTPIQLTAGNNLCVSAADDGGVWVQAHWYYG